MLDWSYWILFYNPRQLKLAQQVFTGNFSIGIVDNHYRLAEGTDSSDVEARCQMQTEAGSYRPL